jgi:hypothetical protein
MRLLAHTISAAALGASIALGSVPAFADDLGSLSGCQKLAEQVKQALASDSQSANYDAAVKEKNYGRDFCSNNFFANGEQHYQLALKLLGETKS